MQAAISIVDMNRVETYMHEKCMGLRKFYPVIWHVSKTAPIKEIRLWADRSYIGKHQSTGEIFLGLQSS